MSAWGHQRTFCSVRVKFAIPPKADMCGAINDVRFGPKADIPNWVTSWILELEALRPDVFRFQTVIRLCQPLLRTALLARQPCARQFFGNCPIRVDSRFCRAHPYTDKSKRREIGRASCRERWGEWV